MYAIRSYYDGEIKGVLGFVRDVMGIFGFEYEMEISTRPEKSIGSDADWERATKALMTALEDSRLPFEINEGDGAFYGVITSYSIHYTKLYEF